jgi:hypothetical protein
MPRLLQPLGLTLASVYLVLISVATFCASSHDLRPAPDHSHSHNNISHSLLCSWACQVSSKANAADTTQKTLIPFILLFAEVFLSLSVFWNQPIQLSLLARGPPKSFLSP